MISSISHFFISPLVRSLTSLTSADYCANPLAPNTTVSAAEISPKRVPTEASYLAPTNQATWHATQTRKSNRHNPCLFHPAKNPRSQHKVLSINTRIIEWRQNDNTQYYKFGQNTIYSLLAVSSIYTPSYLQEIKGKMTHGKKSTTDNKGLRRRWEKR